MQLPYSSGPASLRPDSAPTLQTAGFHLSVRTQAHRKTNFNMKSGSSESLLLAKEETDLSDKQQCWRCHREPVESFQLPSTQYGLTSSGKIKRDLLLQCRHMYSYYNHSIDVCGTYLEKETGNLSWAGWATAISFLERPHNDMWSQLSRAGPDRKQGNKSGEKN